MTLDFSEKASTSGKDAIMSTLVLQSLMSQDYFARRKCLLDQKTRVMESVNYEPYRLNELSSIMRAANKQ